MSACILQQMSAVGYSRPRRRQCLHHHLDVLSSVSGVPYCQGSMLRSPRRGTDTLVAVNADYIEHVGLTFRLVDGLRLLRPSTSFWRRDRWWLRFLASNCIRVVAGCSSAFQFIDVLNVFPYGRKCNGIRAVAACSNAFQCLQVLNVVPYGRK
jgi:hypothetical protein